MDKLVHALAGYALVFTFDAAHVQRTWAVPLVFAVGVGREVTQHPRNDTPEALRDLGAFTIGMAGAYAWDELVNRGPERRRMARALANVVKPLAAQAKDDSLAIALHSQAAAALTVPAFPRADSSRTAPQVPR
jgi:hypothetical protein